MKGTGADVSRFSQKLSERLSEIYRNVTLLEENALKEGNIPLTLSEVHLIRFLSRQENGMAVSDIAEGLFITRPSATVAVNKLQKKGFLQKEASLDDGRVINVKLTPLGRRMLALHKRCQRNAVAKLEGEFTEAEREILLRAVDKLNDYFDKMV